jgi:transcriptional regulator with XRE-family HTH domain
MGETVTCSCSFCKSLSAALFPQTAELLYGSPTMEPGSGLASALIAAAKKARQAKNISPAAMATALEESGPGSVSKVSRFENGKQYREFDRTLAVYSETTGRSLLQLLKDAEDHIKELRSSNEQSAKLDPDSPGGRAAVAAEEAEQKAKARQKASRRGRRKSG